VTIAFAICWSVWTAGAGYLWHVESMPTWVFVIAVFVSLALLEGKR
jgi:hypothetical protein